MGKRLLKIMSLAATWEYRTDNPMLRRSDAVRLGRRTGKTELDRHGMVVRSSGDFFQSRVRAITHPEINQTFDLVVITSRSHKSSFALAAARNAIAPSTVILPLRFDPIQSSILSAEPIGIPLCCVPTMTVKQLRDGSVSHGGDRTLLSIGSSTDSDDGIGLAQKVFFNSEITVELSSDIKSEMWVKFAVSAATAALKILLPFSFDWGTSRKELAFRPPRAKIHTSSRTNSVGEDQLWAVLYLVDFVSAGRG